MSATVGVMGIRELLQAPVDRERCLMTAYEQVSEGQACAGRSMLRQFMPEATIASFERYLGLTQAMVPYPDSSLVTVAAPNAIAVQMPGLKMTKGNEVKSTRHNAKILLEHDAAWDGALALNLRSDRVELVASPPFDVDGTLPIPVGGTLLLQICDWLSMKYGHDAPTPTVMEALRIRAYANRYDPVVDYLRRCGEEWDGVARLDEMLTRFFATADTPYTSMVGSKWMISAVARAIEPGCKVDHTLVLEGGQGAGKSSAFAILGGKYYAEDPPSLIANNGKEFQEWCQGPWIAEFAELEAMRRSEATQVKAVLTATTDRYRASYGSSVEEHPRRFVFAATTNESEYLRDGTGGRRFWPVLVEGTMDLKGLAHARDQLWGEAYVRQQCKEPHWLTTDEEVSLAKIEQEKRMVRDALEDNILEAAEFCAKGDGYTTGPKIIYEVETANGLPAFRSPGNLKERIGKVLKLHGWEYTRRRIDGKLTRIYVPPVVDDDRGNDEEEHGEGTARPNAGPSAPDGNEQRDAGAQVPNGTEHRCLSTSAPDGDGNNEA